ncbi:hypothetical protein TPHA_0G03780 [Tetrapisispora phaffii CBS 4417]|uniref:Major facilitator superfamily (MFS) profile domain-containing protein n=1 Tax=Tetrapisispora phaffii (strain ATCC 24235 / CBS 4417 / NBRC 1672 / NRRL Y-8282 / UCD 70-5) TaxID=1071381 RepID=G8BWD9_TETPH|nr:hypothetical protein TPHA_0G03780 [Tetrapisispora phaffii CBS 4417]CCE64217.1 hypothetical protein TPHA_0G03780 [Tetrapisispora phaffii CBS 4417]
MQIEITPYLEKADEDKISVISDVRSLKNTNDSEYTFTSDSENEVLSPGVHNAKIYGKYYTEPYQRIMIFFSLFLICYAYGLDKKTRTTYVTLATSSYKEHSLMSTVTCITKVISAAGQIWFARASDIFGRKLIFGLSVIFYVIGTVIESQATEISRYAGGECLYGLGHAGIVLTTELYAADFSNLNWRVVAAAAPMLPNIINTWVSGNITADVDENWKWGIGMWAFIFPISCLPLIGCLLHMRYKAQKNNEELKPVFVKPSNMSYKEYLVDVFFWKSDIIGLILLVGVFGLVLVPITLAGGLNKKWNEAQIIVPEVLGWTLALPLYVFWENKFAKYPIIKLETVRDSGIWSALSISLFIDFCFYMHETYLVTFLLVAVNESKKSATRINSLSTFVTVITGFFLGLAIVRIRRTKISIVFGTLVWFVAHGLFIEYNGGLRSHSGLIGAICLLGFGNGFIRFPVRASIQVSVGTHEKLAIVTSLFLAVGSIGTAIGSAVAGAIWSNVLPGQIESRISNATIAASAYSSPTTFIKKYKWGTEYRTAVVSAYGYVWKILNITGLVLVLPLLISALFLRDRKLESVLAFDEVTDTEGYSENEKVQQKKHKSFMDYFN